MKALLLSRLEIRTLILLAMLLFVARPGQALAGMQEEPDPSASVTADRWNIHLSYVGGYKFFDETWIPAQHQAEFGLVDFDIGKNSWPVNFCAQLLLSYSPVRPRLPGIIGDFSGAFEFNLGIRKVFRVEERIQPHVAAGIGAMGAGTTSRIEGVGYFQEGNESEIGYWANAGFYWMFSDNYHTGLSLAYSKATVTLFDENLGVGGSHVLFYFGYHW